VSEKTKESKKEGNQNTASMVFLGYGCFFFMIITKNSNNLGFSSTYRTRGQTHTIIIKRKLADSHKEHFGFRV
jgi:hypothetical protein